MRILALTPNQLGYAPGQRGSIELWESELKAVGINITYAPFESDALRRILYYPGKNLAKAVEMARCYLERSRMLTKLDDYDAVFVYREAALIGPAFFERLIARRKPIIYQLDDPLHVPYKSQYNGYFSHLKFFGKIKEIIRMSRAVIANSSHIRDFALQYNKNVWQVPSVVDTDKYVYQPQPETPDRVCIGWSGSPTTVGNIRIVSEALRRLQQKADFDLHLIGGTEFDLPGVKYTGQKWSGETEVEDLRRMQIGLVPLPVNEWNKRKFFMKSAQYMALGIVPVGTPMGSNPEVIRHGENGFLADSDEEWIECLHALLTDSQLRGQMSAQAARDAEEKYSLRANMPKVIEAFRSVAGGS